MDSPNPADSNLRLAHIPFEDPEAAKVHFIRVAKQLSSALASALPSLVAESPDPDSALLLLDRLVNEHPELITLLNAHNFLAHYTVVVFGHSRFLGETLIQNPDLLQSFLREKNLDRSFSREEFHGALARFRSRSFETDVSLLLARFKRREYVRIMLRDVLKIAPLAETTAEISALADVLIEDALREAERRLQRRYGTPQHLDAERRLVNTPFAILSLGKLGGNELNYSSDVDLTYIFGDGDEAPQAPISNREFFIRLAQQVTEILSRATREGPPFRIDLRLRPQGGEGELAISRSQALNYYQTIAHDWEQQALIKLRYSAGDPALAREFIRAVQPHVYTEKVNFAAIKTALVARERMQKHRRSKLWQDSDSTMDAKIDSGGIRDIEFLVQCLQRVYGGREPWLRSGGTLFSLHKLHDKRHISGKEFHELSSAYEFLRHLEHRLQLRHGHQTHRLPTSASELQIVQRSMEGLVPGADRLSDLPNLVRGRMHAVAEIYRRIIYHQQTQHVHEPQTTEFQLTTTLEPSAADSTGQQLMERLAADAPPLYQAAARQSLSATAKKSLLRFFSSVLASSERYATVVRHANVVERALEIFDTSEYLAEILIRHPEEIASLAELNPGGETIENRLLFEDTLRSEASRDPVFQYLATSPASYAQKLSLLRQHFRHRIFVSVARDVVHPRPVYESFAATTTAAEDAIAAAFIIAGAPRDLAVFALGRVGTGEFDILSDADLLFVCAENADRQSATKAAERMMQALAAYTQEGMVFPVDPRLRPRGGEGELLVTTTQLAAYFEHEAQAWESLTYTKLRFLIGDRNLADRATQALPVLFNRFAADGNFIPAVREMRAKLEIADAPANSFKTSAGATYDIDFLANSLLVKHKVKNKQGTLRDRLWRCAESGALEKCDAAALDHAAELLRSTEHAVRLVTGRALKWLPATEHGRHAAEKLTSKVLRRDFSNGLEADLNCTCRKVRAIYERAFASLTSSN